jgi:hypothetical protein
MCRCSATQTRAGSGIDGGYRSGFRWTGLWLACWLCVEVLGQVWISEIMYHPVERPAFDAEGRPVLDLSRDIHEFVEIHNAGTEAVALAGWRIGGGISYRFPADMVIEAGAYRVVARDPARLAAVVEYGLDPSEVWGPYEGRLSNSGDRVQLRDGTNQIVDAVEYLDRFPWAIGADGLGATDRWTGLNRDDHQYRGRSLERVSFTHTANDPANWLASPIPGEPSPGRPNAVQRDVPQPVVIWYAVYQDADEERVIRAGQPVRIDARFSATNDLSAVRVEYYVVDLNAATFSTTTVAMNAVGGAGSGEYTALLPGFSNRQVIRYRFLADRGDGVGRVSPRLDDPFEWHAFFVSPVRSDANPMYDVFISNASWDQLRANIDFPLDRRRVTGPDPPGYPRESWNATEPAIFVHDNVVYDIQMRHRGSRWNRRVSNNSFKFSFPRYAKFREHSVWLVTNKGNDTIATHGLFREAGMPTSLTRRVTLYLNNNSALNRVELEDYDDDMLDWFYAEQARRYPGSGTPPIGFIHKSTGSIDDEGPYGRGDGALLPPRSIWTPLDRYAWTYHLKNDGWVGYVPFREMIEGMWAARNHKVTGLGDVEIAQLRAYFQEHWNVDMMLTYISIMNWTAPWDDIFHNYYVWRGGDGRWCLLPWDFDGLFGDANASIFAGEVGDRSNNFRGHNYFKDSFIKAFREEIKERLFVLNHTLLHPENITALGYGWFRSFADSRFTSVNQQVGLGTFHRPVRPVHEAPVGGQPITPPFALRTSAYSHTGSPGTPHASTIWLFRTVDGDYREPWLRIESTEHLTSLPAPFEELEFGRTYYWRVIHVDANGHPSVASQETSFVFGQGETIVRLLGIDAATMWRYNQTASFSATQTAWRQPDYDDVAWPSGAPLFEAGNRPLPEPIRTPLTLGRITYYFRTTFDYPGAAGTGTLRLRHILDDGMVLYLNGTEILRVNMPAGPIGYDTLANVLVTTAVYSDWIEVPVANLRAGENVLAAEVHQVSTGSSDIAFGLVVETRVAAASGAIVLNEIMASNRTTLANGERYPDWVELFNTSDEPVDVGGMAMSDDMLRPDRFVFPVGTVIPGRGYLLVWFDDALDEPGLYTGFGLSRDGETLALFEPTPDGYRAVDWVKFGIQLPDHSIGRVPDVTGPWMLTVPTPGGVNVAHGLGSPWGLRINEWMARPTSGEDWFEIYNSALLPVDISGFYLSDRLEEPTRSQVPALSFIGPQDFHLFVADGRPDRGASHVDFSLSAAGEAIGLYDPELNPIDELVFDFQALGESEGRLPDGSPTIVRFATTPTPGASNYLPLDGVVINEVLTHTNDPLEDAIELKNVSEETIDIGGWYLSDSWNQPQRYRVPDGTILDPGGYAVFYEYQFNPEPGSPTSFALSSSRGDRVVLSAAGPDGQLTGYRTQVMFGPAEDAVSLGRFETSQAVDFVALSARTFGVDEPSSVEEFRLGTGLPNAYPKVGPVVLNELMYHPPALEENGELVDNVIDEYVELHNVTDMAVALFDPAQPENTWRLDDGIRFMFPTGVVIPARGFILVVNFDPEGDPAQNMRFRALHQVPEDVPLYGPYDGRLSNSGERIELLKPDRPQGEDRPDAGLVPYILVDHIEYGDREPWPREADGQGASLQRLDALAYGNEPLNWFAAPPSAGHPNETLRIFDVGWVDPPPGFRLRFQAHAGHAYTVQVRHSWAAGDWEDLVEVPAEPESRVAEVIDAGAGPGNRYYRVVRE